MGKIQGFAGTPASLKAQFDKHFANRNAALFFRRPFGSVSDIDGYLVLILARGVVGVLDFCRDGVYLIAAVADKSLRAACARRLVAPEVGTVTFFEAVGDFVDVGGIGGFHLAPAFLIAVGRNQTDGVGCTVGAADGEVARLLQVGAAGGVRAEVDVVGGDEFADGAGVCLYRKGETVAG